MGKKGKVLTQRNISFIAQQKVFFVATAAKTGTINLSPKGLDSLRVLNPSTIVWLNLTGSGNETAAHLMQTPRITLMMCAFEGAPQILRIYGNGTTYNPSHSLFQEYYSLFSPNVGARQIIEIKVEMVQTSCGFGVPLMDFKNERTALNNWSNKLGASEIETYQKKKNMRSLDGFKTDNSETC